MHTSTESFMNKPKNPVSRGVAMLFTPFFLIPLVPGDKMNQVTKAQVTPEVSALALSVEEEKALADSLISSLGGHGDEGVQAPWEAEIGKRIAELDSGAAKTTSWEEVRKRNLAKLPHAQ
jgi:putative addiction module component (TIGR02574 family)